MSQSRENSFNLASPQSSASAGDAFRATPDTHLRAFSPGENSTKSSKPHQNFSGSTSAATPVKPLINSFQRHISQLDKDPFVTPIHNTRLSPTASTFSPDSESFAFSISHNSGPIATVLSTELGISHDLDVSSSSPVSISEVDTCLTDLIEKGANLRGNHEFRAIGEHVFVHFSDIRDACWAFSALQLIKQGWSVTYAARDCTGDEPNGLGDRLLQLGQVHFIANPPLGSGINAAQMTEVVQNVLQSSGDLFAFVRQISYPDGSFRGIAQFCKASDASVAIKTCNGITTGGIHIAVTPATSKALVTQHITEAFQEFSLTNALTHPYPHEVTSNKVAPVLPSQSALSMYPFMIQSPLAPNMPFLLDHVPAPGSTSAVGSMASSYPMIRPLYQTPPSPAMTVRTDFSPSRASSGYPRFDTRRQNAARIVRSPYHNSASHHNHVDIGRIRDGIDVRTTIMLRNIPNKVDQVMLKRIIDDSSWGKYDFMYLRIDFANDCNVGYAFINFVDPLDIIDFVNARGNQRWNCFKSDKVAEISYATIQGKDCLVQKFRNSSVMLEAPHYRPKLFFTSNGPVPELAGQEEAFPEPDNQSKMKRSCENAEHVGLFTPNSGQHFRDEQRRRRSQYDRGTRLAALEEYDYDTTIQQYYGPSAQ